MERLPLTVQPQPQRQSAGKRGHNMPSPAMTGLAGALQSQAPREGVPTGNEPTSEGFFVDSIEDGVATIVTEDATSPEGFKTQQIPVQQLPAGVKEGDTVMPDGTVQSGMGGQAIESKRQCLAGADPGGNIEL